MAKCRQASVLPPTKWSHYKRASWVVNKSECEAKNWERDDINGRSVGVWSQHFSNISQIWTSICGQCDCSGRPPATTVRMTLASFFIRENGMRPVKIYSPLAMGGKSDKYTNFNHSHCESPHIYRGANLRDGISLLIYDICHKFRCCPTPTSCRLGRKYVVDGRDRCSLQDSWNSEIGHTSL